MPIEGGSPNAQGLGLVNGFVVAQSGAPFNLPAGSNTQILPLGAGNLIAPNEGNWLLTVAHYLVITSALGTTIRFRLNGVNFGASITLAAAGTIALCHYISSLGLLIPRQDASTIFTESINNTGANPATLVQDSLLTCFLHRSDGLAAPGNP